MVTHNKTISYFGITINLAPTKIDLPTRKISLNFTSASLVTLKLIVPG